MRRLILALLVPISLILSSCSSTYFYSVLNTTNNDVVKVDNGDFLFENDSLWIAHCFKGQDAPIQITVFNKLDVPLFIDWQRSTLILDGVAHPYSSSRVTYVGSAEGVVNQDGVYDGVHHTYSNIQSSLHLPQHVSFIPPQTMVSHTTLRLAVRFDEIKNKEYTNAKLSTTEGQTVDIKKINYNQQNTPLRFGSYLTVYTKPEKPQAFRTNFYVTNLIKTTVEPKKLPADMAERGDTFYQQKEPNNIGWEILAGTALTVGVVAVDVMISD